MERVLVLLITSTNFKVEVQVSRDVVLIGKEIMERLSYRVPPW